MLFALGRTCSAILLLLLAFGTPVAAQNARPLTLVPRLGVTVSPEQFTFGVEVPMSNIADIEFLVFAPSFDIGLGDQRTTLRANANLGYSVPTGSPNTRVFPLVGVAAYHQSIETTVDGQSIDGSATDFGVNIGAGAQVGELVVEGLIGIGQLPSLSVFVGYSLIL